jgi:hypothetical protein
MTAGLSAASFDRAAPAVRRNRNDFNAYSDKSASNRVIDRQCESSAVGMTRGIESPSIGDRRQGPRFGPIRYSC